MYGRVIIYFFVNSRGSNLFSVNNIPTFSYLCYLPIVYANEKYVYLIPFTIKSSLQGNGLQFVHYLFLKQITFKILESNSTLPYDLLDDKETGKSEPKNLYYLCNKFLLFFIFRYQFNFFNTFKICFIILSSDFKNYVTQLNFGVSSTVTLSF